MSSWYDSINHLYWDPDNNESIELIESGTMGCSKISLHLVKFKVISRVLSVNTITRVNVGDC